MSEESDKSKKYNEELNKELLFKYISNGDLNKVKELIENKSVDINTTKYSITALSVCAANCDNSEVMKYILSKGPEIRDSLFHAIRAGKLENVELLLSKFSKKSEEMNPIKDSPLFPPYMTPLMLAAISGHRQLIKLLMIRDHKMAVPHLAHCDCDDCNVSSTQVMTPSQRNLDIFRALCNPQYIGLNASDPIKKTFELEMECRSIIKDSSYFSHHYNDLFRKMESYVKEIFDVTRDAEEVKVLIKQRDSAERNIFLKYIVLQRAVDHNWVDFIASKRIENLRSHLWLGHNKTWFQTGIQGLGKRFLTSLFVILLQLLMAMALVFRYRKHNSAQERYLCKIFNESMFAFSLLYHLNSNRMKGITKVLIFVWTFANIVNILKKWAIFGLNKLWGFYGYLFELLTTLQLLIIIYFIFICKDIDITEHMTPLMIRMLIKVIHIRLLIIASIRAYKGLEEQHILRLFLLSFTLISVFCPIYSESITHFSSLEAIVGLKTFGNCDPTYVLIGVNFLIGFTFEIFIGPEKMSDKKWCFHWTARLIHEIHGGCELPVPFNLFETHKVIYIWLKRVGLKEKVSEEDILQYQRIRKLVYSRYECIKYFDSKNTFKY